MPYAARLQLHELQQATTDKTTELQRSQRRECDKALALNDELGQRLAEQQDVIASLKAGAARAGEQEINRLRHLAEESAHASDQAMTRALAAESREKQAWAEAERRSNELRHERAVCNTILDSG